MALDPIVIGSYSCNISSPSAFYHDLELIVGQWCKSAHMIDPLTSIEEVIELFPLSALENAIRTHEVSYQDVISTAKASINQANYYLKWTQKSPISVGFWTPFYEAFITFLETLLNIFGIADIFEPSDSTFDANSKFQKVMMLLSFTCLTTGLVPILGLATSSLIVGGLLLTLVLLSLIYPKIRPLPFSLPHATNWTKQIQEGVFTETYDRRSVVSEIAECLISSEKIKKHPMLIGKTRVGKTQAAMAFAIAVERGDYPSLKDKVVYYVNAADLISAGDPFGNKVKTLSSLKKGIGHHKNNIILIIDEIHLTQREDQAALGGLLKLLLDEGQESFPYVIGITTEEDFYRDIFVRDFAFASRFKQIPVESASEEETLEILTRFLLKEAPHILIDDGALSHILEVSKEAVQPATALHLISRVITKTGGIESSPIKEKVKALQGEISFCLSQNKNTSTLEENFELLTRELEKETVNLQELHAAQAIFPRIKEAAFQTAVRIAGLGSTHLEQKRYLLLTRFLIPAMEKYLRERSKEIGVHVAISKDLIDFIAKEERLQVEKVSTLIRAGQEAISLR